MSHWYPSFSSTPAKLWSRLVSQIQSLTLLCCSLALAGLVLLLLYWPSGAAAAQEVRVVGSPPGDAVPVVRFAPRGQPDNWQEAQPQGGSYRLVDSGGRVDPGNYFIRVSASGCEDVTEVRFVDASTRFRVWLDCENEPGGTRERGEQGQGVQLEPSATPNLGSFTHTVLLESSRGHPIEEAQVQLTLGPGFAAQGTAVEQTVRYMHEGNGRYVASFNLASGDVAANAYELRVEAQDHAPYVRPISGLNRSYRAEAVHNNYYARCNERMPTDTWNFWRTDPWKECSIDPERLIETFGSDHKRFLLPSPGGSREKATFRGRTYVFHPDISAVVHSFSRSLAYDKLIPKIVQAPARAHAIATGRVAMEEIEQQLAANERLSLGELTARTAGTLAEIAEALESFAGPLSAAGHAFSLTQAHRDGQLEGMVQVAAHTVGMEQAVAQFETLVADSWLREDKLLVDAIEKVKKTIAEEREATIEEIVANYGNAEFNDAAEAIVFGASAKAIFGGALKAVGVGAVVKTAAVFAVHDFLRSVEDRDQERTMLAAAALLDRELLSRYPDRLEDMNPGTMEPDELNGAIMRLALGILFNETRAAHLGGESRTLVGRGFQYAFASEMPSSEREAYDREMIRVSLEKSEQAEEGIAQLAVFLTDDITYAAESGGGHEGGASSELLQSLNGTVWANKRNIRGSGGFTQFKEKSITDLIYWNLPYKSGCKIINIDIIFSRNNIIQTKAGDGTGKISLDLNDDNLSITVLEKFSGVNTDEEILFFPEGTKMEFERVDSFPSNIDRCETVFN